MGIKMTEEEYKLIIGGIIEYISESTDFRDFHIDIGEIFPKAVDWAEKLEKGLKEKPLPPKTPCTCPNEWAKERMKTVEDILYSWKVREKNDHLCKFT